MSLKSLRLSVLMRLAVVGACVLVATIAVFAQTLPARAATVCNNGDTITQGKYWLYNNLWGASSGSGSQCISDTSQSGNSIAWSTNWNWSGSSNSVKSYDSSVLGWHWGWKIANTGLPVQLSSNTSVNTSWSFNLNQTTAGGQDVAYDIWISTDPNLGNANPTDEVMVWLDYTGSIQPVGSPVGTTNVDGSSWTLWEGNAGWQVHSFVRSSTTTSASLNLSDFFNYLIQSRGLSSSKYLISVEAGTEVFTGAGTLNTTNYSVTIGGSGNPTPTPTHTTNTPTPTPTHTTNTPTPTPTPTQGSGCSVHYTVTSQWPGGFGGSIVITNTGNTTINGWSLAFSFPNGQTITQLWNGNYTQSGSNVTVNSLSYNGTLAPGATVNPGFNGSWNGSNGSPTSYTLNGVRCSIV
jgi:hypothetical protein